MIMTAAPPKDRIGDLWLLAGVVAMVAATIALYLTSLLWTVAAPTLVATALLLVGVAPTVVYAARRGGSGWLLPVFLAAAAVFLGGKVVRDYEPPAEPVVAVFATTPLPTWPGAGPVRARDECRYWCMFNSATPTSAGVEVTSDDVQGTCLEMGAQLLAAGWAPGPPVPNPDWCQITVTKPAPLGRSYVIELSVSPDHLRPVDDLVTGPPQPGRVFTGIHVA
jgi:hypothetical protein